MDSKDDRKIKKNFFLKRHKTPNRNSTETLLSATKIPSILVPPLHFSPLFPLSLLVRVPLSIPPSPPFVLDPALLKLLQKEQAREQRVLVEHRILRHHPHQVLDSKRN
mmetsp:Transcript_14608/g.25674  ORF Transcript_14608/g.25674 Transcript_14608/m.25674 type:complete len:108 (-) Transcript_14608:40-363(-)